MADAPVQNPLSLLLTLKHDLPVDQFQLSLGEVKSATDATNILHFAWIIRVPNTTNQVMLCTVYDGDFDAYLDAFIDANMAGFNFVLSQLVNAPEPHLEKPAVRAEFHKWARENNYAKEGKGKTDRLGGFFSAYPEMTVDAILQCPEQQGS